MNRGDSLPDYTFKRPDFDVQPVLRLARRLGVEPLVDGKTAEGKVPLLSAGVRGETYDIAAICNAFLDRLEES